MGNQLSDNLEEVGPKAEELRQRIRKTRDEMKLQDPLLIAIAEEVDGILDGQAKGYIRYGQPRLADRLTAMIELVGKHHPKRNPPDELISALSDCAMYGLTADGQEIGGPQKVQSHVSNLSK